MSLSALLNALPDSHFMIDDIIAPGNRVVTTTTLTGTQTGDVAGIPATGKRVTMRYVDMRRVREDMIGQR